MTNQLRREVINLYKQVGTSVIILASHRPFHIAHTIARANLTALAINRTRK